LEIVVKLQLAKNHQPQSKAWQVLKPFAQYESTNGVPTVWGLGSGNFDIVKKAKHFLFTDMPYWNRYNPDVPQGEYHWRTCIDNIHVTEVMDLPGDRSAHIDLKEWRDYGEYILVAPSSLTVHRYIGKPNWTEDTVKKLKTVTDLPIRIRDKPRRKGTSGPHVADTPLAVDFQQAKFVVTSCSVVGVESIIEGIPTFCEPEAACAPMSNTDIFSLEPEFPDRQLWLNTLSYHQWTPAELQSGKFASEFADMYQGVFDDR
jgi:hypothetical protein